MRCKGLFRVGWMVLLGAVSGIPVWVGVGALADVGQPPVSFEDVSELINFPVRSFTVGGNAQVGAAWFDYDKDGWLDLYLTNGCNQENGLFRNNGNGTFSNVAAEAGVTNGLGSNGVIAADIDNDGFQDLFVTGEGGYQGSCARPVVLYHNNGDGTFDDITASSGIVGPSTQFSAAMADINNDGFLDLFITGSGRQSGIGPPNKLFLNNGDLTFLDISALSGVDTDRGACAAFFTDVNDDGFIDLHVANCVPFFPAERNELFMNNGDLSFTEVGVAAGLGATGYWMGFGPGDFDNDGDIDIFVTNLGAGFVAFNRLHRNNGDGSYTNVAFAAGAAVSEFGWGATMTDFDNDGFADIFFAGACPSFAIGAGAGNPGTMLFNRGDGTFANHTQDMPTNLSSRSTAGVAAGDYDNDGFVDIVIAADAFGADPGGPTIFHNLGNDNGWVTIKLQGTTSNRDAVGARVSVTAGGMTQTKEIYAGSSFLSMDSQWLVFGLGAQSGTEQITVRWPSGIFETFPNASAGETVTLVEGPMITCPDNETITSGDSTDPAATGMPTANDNCGDDVDIAVSDNAVFPDCLADPVHFVIERTWTTTDDCGNSSECVQIITVMRQQVSLIIKQGACPAPVNAHSNGVVPMLLVGEPGFDVTAVLTPSLRVSRCECGGGDGSVPPIDGPPGPKIQVLDLNHPFDGEVTCAGPCACNADHSGDGIDDLSMKFPTNDMVNDLPLSLGEGLVILSLTGDLDAVAYPAGPIKVGFVASDCIVIVPQGDLAPANAFVGANVTDTFVAVTPIDLNVDGGGFADFARSYYSGTTVTLTAPPRSDGRRFVRWSVDGVLQEVGVRTLDLVVDQDIKLRAVYEHPRRPRPDQPREGDGDLD